jgi:SMC interacting uncharacterized protein involved in chromosome segregation
VGVWPVFLGAIFRTVKGGYDAVTIRKKIKGYNLELSQDLLMSFTPYEQFFAQERMLLAEYIVQLSKLKAKEARIEELFKLKERMNHLMKEMVEKAEKELEARNATKLDLARVVTSLRELSLAVDRDLNNFRKEIAADQKKLQSKLKELDSKAVQFTERLEQQSKETSALQKKAQTLSSGVEGLTKGLQKQDLRSTKRVGLIWGFNIIVFLVMIFLLWRH